MGPLVPDIIGNDLNFIVAFFIGIGFGFILEQAGFSTSKKLVGLFYGYDFTVLRVFFTAGITAMFGVILLGHYGLLDLSLIYVNPTFLWSAIVGGLIMGLGFVIGGYCPGTSIAGAAIGKVDAMIFIAGSFIGVLMFAEGYPLLETLYKSSNWGNVRIFETLGISQGLFAFILVLIAIGAFWAVRIVENKVNKISGYSVFLNKRYLGLTTLALMLGFSALFLPDNREKIITKADELKSDYSRVQYITSDELAFRIIDKDSRIAIYDLRTAKEYDSLSLPNSTRIAFTNLFEKDTRKMLGMKQRINVFINNDEAEARKAALIAEQLGYKGLYVLQGGMPEFKRDYLRATPVKENISADTYRFRQYAAALMPQILKEYAAGKTKSVKKGTKRALGGC